MSSTQNATSQGSTARLPKSVQMQAAKSRELQMEIEKRFKEETPTGTQVSPPVVKQPELHVEPVITPERVTPVAAVPSVPEVKPEPEKDVKYWEHRAKTMQGMFEAEKSRLRSENAQLKEQFGGLQKQLTDMQSKLQSAERQAPVVVDLKKYFSQEEIDTYGPDVLKAVHKTATHAAVETSDRRIQEEITRQVAPLKQKLETSEQQLTVNKEAEFWAKLNKEVPRWSAINTDEAFHTWLMAKDPMTGFTRQQLLEGAQAGLDADRAVAVFNAYVQSSPAPKPSKNEATQSQVVPDPVGQTSIVNAPIEEVIGPHITKAEISQYYKEAATGRYKFRPQEKKAMEEKIRAAYLAGTIV